MTDNNFRSLLKAISWRIIGTLDTFVISFFVTGKVWFATTISACELLTKTFLYYGHERLWNKISWGKKPEVAVLKHNHSPINTDTSPYKKATAV